MTFYLKKYSLQLKKKKKLVCSNTIQNDYESQNKRTLLKITTS